MRNKWFQRKKQRLLIATVDTKKMADATIQEETNYKHKEMPDHCELIMFWYHSGS